MELLHQTKYQINKISGDLSKLNIRRTLIVEAQNDLQSRVSHIDLQQLEAIYTQACAEIKGIQKTFEELVAFHNTMISEKTKFIIKDLPEIEKNIKSKTDHLKRLLDEELSLTKKISRSAPFGKLEEIISTLNEKFRIKGEYESIIQQIATSEKSLDNLQKQVHDIEEGLFSSEFEGTIKQQVNKFNYFFSKISQTLYGEQYGLKADKHTDKNGHKIYKFTAFNTNFSSGKKQGEISCFDIAYTLFADSENIPCLHFLLNDKKELVHDNQLIKIARLAKDSNIQFIASILKDKLPDELKAEANFILKLSQHDKLFRIEQSID